MKRAVQLPATGLDMAATARTFETDEGFTQAHAGLRVWKTVDDMARYRGVIEATRPEVIVETGTKWGGFAAWLADTFGVEVITVDIERAEGRPDTWPGVTFVVEGSSIDTEVIAGVRRRVKGRRTMVTLDADHHAPHVRREIQLYGPLVTRGCYLVVEDGFADLVEYDLAQSVGRRIPRCGGPLWAIAHTLPDNPDWQRDEAIEHLTPISHHPAGWWRRR